MDKHAFFSELVKLNAVSAEDAEKSLERLDSLEKAKLTGGQVARYGALGAGVGAVTKAVTHHVEHGKLPKSRAMLGAAVGGASGMAAVPLIRSALDRHVEKGKLRKFLHEGGEEKAAFAVSQYSGPLSMGAFKMVSGLPPRTAPSLSATVQRRVDPVAMSKSAVMMQRGLTPAGMLSSAQRIGTAKITAPGGPSLADLSKPIGYGTKIPGATKGSL